VNKLVCTSLDIQRSKFNHETLVVWASCPLDMYLIIPESAV